MELCTLYNVRTVVSNTYKVYSLFISFKSYNVMYNNLCSIDPYGNSTFRN